MEGKGEGVRTIQSFLLSNQVDGDVSEAGTRVGSIMLLFQDHGEEAAMRHPARGGGEARGTESGGRGRAVTCRFRFGYVWD